MKRTLGSLLVLGLASSIMAQSSFTIVRPADGSKVRETFRLLFPKNSIPDGGYVGIYFGGKFHEAVVPARGANYLYYDVDSKAMKLPDGPLTIDAVLFQDFADRPRIVDRSSIQVNVANAANIPVPDNGLTLRYKFRPGTQWIYKLTQRVAVNNMSETRANSTDKASLLKGAETEQVRLLYSVDNAYSGGDGLLRIQALPDPGKRTLTLTTVNSEAPRVYQDYQIHSIYMRLSSTGKEIFGSVPEYFPMEGSPGEGWRTDLMALYPLPTMPTRPQPIGGAWETGFQLGDLDLENFRDTKSLVARLQARGELVGVEWQNGHPCARIRHSLSVRDPKAPAGRGRLVNAQAIDEDIWFALDLGTVVKMIRTYTIDARVDVPVTNTGGGSGVANAGGSGTRNEGGTGRQGSSIDVHQPGNKGQSIDVRQGSRGGPPQLGGVGGAGGTGVNQAPQLGGASGAGSVGGGGTRSGGGTTTRVVRITVEQVFELQK